MAIPLYQLQLQRPDGRDCGKLQSLKQDRKLSMNCPTKWMVIIFISFALLVPVYVLSLPHVVTQERLLKVGDKVYFAKDPNVGEWFTITARDLPSVDFVTSSLILRSEHDVVINLTGRAELDYLHEKKGLKTTILTIDGFNFVGANKPLVGSFTVDSLPQEVEFGFYICDRRTDLQRLINSLTSKFFGSH